MLLGGVLLLAVPVALVVGYRLGRRVMVAEVEAEAARGLERLRLVLGVERNEQLQATGSDDTMTAATMTAAIAEVDRLTGQKGDDAR